MTDATHEDAHLILKLYDLRREDSLRKARKWFTGTFSAGSLQEFTEICRPGSDENAYFRMVTSYWDMAGLFVVQGVLNEELFIRSAGELLVVWERVRPFIDELREAYENPNLLVNLEQVAQRQVEWMDETAPGSYQALQRRIHPQ